MTKTRLLRPLAVAGTGFVFAVGSVGVPRAYNFRLALARSWPRRVLQRLVPCGVFASHLDELSDALTAALPASPQ
jgi:hypothetical protein